MLISPIYSAAQVISSGNPFKLNFLDTESFLVKNHTKLTSWSYSQTDLTQLVEKVALKS